MQPAPAAGGSRDLLVSSAAAVLLLVGLLSLPGLLQPGGTEREANAATPAAASASAADRLVLVTNMLRLPGGLTFEMAETATGTETVVSEVPPEAAGSLAVGDVLLVYTPTGESLGTATALRDILTREFANGVTTYSFGIRRGASTLNAEFRLGVTG